MQFNKLTLCLVVANSSDCLERFFKWSLPRFSDIVIVKSDSEDNTDEILDFYKSKYPDQINLSYKKINNIADQKQHCLNLAQKEWRLIVDADEILEEINFDLLISKLEQANIDLVFIPRYNLQIDESHYQPEGYPDYQPRLMKSNVQFSMHPIHETHHAMIGFKQACIIEPHIIHWGHIRNEEQNLWKSKMRRKYADTDLCDGDGLKTTENWFFERNKILDMDAKAIPLNDSVIQYIKNIQ